MRILIPGGCGFVGGNLAVYFAERGHQVTCYDNFLRKGTRYNGERIKKHGVEVVELDVAKDDFDATDAVVLNCAAQSGASVGLEHPEVDFYHNTIGAFRVLENCRKAQAPLIFWSSNKVFPARMINRGDTVNSPFRFGLPGTTRLTGLLGGALDEHLLLGELSIYGATKAAAECMIQEYAAAYGLPCIINRFSAMAGPYQYGKPEQGWVAWFCIAAELGLPVQYFGWEGKQVRDVLHIEDVCRLVERQLLFAELGPFQVGGGSGRTLSVRELVTILNTEHGYRLNPQTALPRYADHNYYVSDNRRVNKAFHWCPTIPVEQTIDDIVKWVRREREALKEIFCGAPIPQAV